MELCEAGGGDLPAVAAKISKYEKQSGELVGRLRDAEGRSEPPAPVTATQIESLVADLHSLLRDDPASVAPVLRELTGPVAVTQEKQEGKRGAVWVALLSVNLVPVLARLTRRRDCPTSGTWGYLARVCLRNR